MDNESVLKSLNLKLFNPNQIKEILYGYQDDVNIAVYANPRNIARTMYIVRKCMVLGYDYNDFLDNDYSDAKLKLFEEAINKGYNPKYYSNPNFNNGQLVAIISGIKLGVDVSLYADPKYNPQQMYVLLKYIRKGKDVSKFLDNRYSANAMDNLMDLEDKGYDISSILDPDIKSADLYEMILEMKRNKVD